VARKFVPLTKWKMPSEIATLIHARHVPLARMPAHDDRYGLRCQFAGVFGTGTAAGAE
jgi:hypothetical protein